jgi:hypothetical protein
MVEIPRSTFNFDFEYERRILAEAEKENPNWTKFVVERQAPPPPVAQQARYIDPAISFFLSFTSLLISLTITQLPLAIANVSTSS